MLFECQEITSFFEINHKLPRQGIYASKACYPFPVSLLACCFRLFPLERPFVGKSCSIAKAEFVFKQHYRIRLGRFG